MYLPQATRAASSAASQVGRELAEASQVCGASPVRTLVRVLLPLMLPGLVAGWVILFVLMVQEVTASALLASTRTPVVGFVILDLWENGTFPQLAALAVIMTVISSVIVLTALRLTRGVFESRIS
jgi:iron(III) transport system permease protein